MFNIHKKEITWCGRPLTIETGQVARQADGAVMITYGETVVLCTAVGSKGEAVERDFLPLTVNYQEKTYAAGRIPGGFFKREGRPSEHETLTSRLIDRPIRPLFAKNHYADTQVICTVLSHDMVNSPDIVALIGASAALTLSGMPFLGPLGAIRLGYADGDYLFNPTPEELKTSELDLIVAGTQEGVLMVESEAKELSEDIMLTAVVEAHKAFQPVIDMIIDLAEEAAKEPWTLPEKSPNYDLCKTKVEEVSKADFVAAYQIQEKQDRTQALQTVRKSVREALAGEEDFPDIMISKHMKALEADIVRGSIIDGGARIDGRDTETVRPIMSTVSLLPKTHGSALFTRGETQALVVATLGTGDDEQMIDALEGMYKNRYMLHYNFPPFSVGETGRVGAPGRREIGHGKLAWRALHAVLPDYEGFPYVLRAVSEVTESNGSSSMATVCGTSLAFMDAGVPLKRPVAGIAMGLIKEGERFKVLSDIMGDEDHLGDMDFKVAGTEQGITALQMDIKITSITKEIMETALEQAHNGRQHILGEMAKALSSSREEISGNAPQITSFKIPTTKIRDVIGSGGKVIREITETTNSKIDIDDDGTIRIAAINAEDSKRAIEWVKNITGDPTPGETYKGKVVSIVDFGAFVGIFNGHQEGLVHISEIAHERVEKVSDYLKEGQEVEVKCLSLDDRGRIKLSMKALIEKE